MQQLLPGLQQRFGRECSAIIRLVGPIVVAQLTVTGMSFVDTIMAGAVSSTDLAAVAVGASFLNPVILFLQGVLIAVTPLVAYQIGARTPFRAGVIVQQAVLLSLILAAIAWALISMNGAVFKLMEIEPELIALTQDYLFYVSFGLPAFAVYQALRAVNEAASNIKVIMIIGVAGLLLNIPVNYIFINGHLGLPKFGGVGCGIATALVNWFMVICLVWYVARSKTLKPLKLTRHWYGFVPKHSLRILKLGLPIGGAIFFEVTLFSTIALLISPLGADVVAAHQVTLNFSSMVFMLPLSIGIALTIRVGNLLGAKQYEHAQTAALSGVILAVLLTIAMAAFTVIFRYEVIGWYTNDLGVVAIAAPLFLLAATYQFSDSIQVCCGGALRGYQDTKVVLYVTLISFWPIGLGIGSVLAFTDWITDSPMGVTGYWVAIVLALTSCALGLLGRLIWISKDSERVKVV